ncbi:putative glucose dehydrogenase [Rhyzopertha dominica]|nr:putative glucose dehydrogenase [Rhyzopertha dominica]
MFAYFLTILVLQDALVSTKADDYDFIVVGAGSAGAIVATRLSEINDWNILLLEAGGYPNELSNIPYDAAFMQLTENNYNFSFEPQENACLGMRDQRCSFPRGKGLGGSSLINYVIYCRGNPADFDYWEELGNPGWSYEDVLPYFKKSEEVHIAGVDYDYHGTTGPVGTNITYKDVFGEAFLQSAIEAGYEYNEDYNGAEQFGFSWIQGNIGDGVRQSTYKSFLEPNLDRENLNIVTYAQVSKVLFDDNNTAYASPQVLILSGVGPKDDLEELGIPLVQDLPVGKVYRDHISYWGLAVTTNESTVLDLVSATLEYTLLGTGPLAAPGGMQTTALLKVNNETANNGTDLLPDMQFFWAPQSIVNNPVVAELMFVRDEVLAEYALSVPDPYQFSMYPTVLHPKSVGYIKVTSHLETVGALSTSVLLGKRRLRPRAIGWSHRGHAQGSRRISPCRVGAVQVPGWTSAVPCGGPHRGDEDDVNTFPGCHRKKRSRDANPDYNSPDELEDDPVTP